MVMRKHQRYFPVYGSEEELQSVFVTVANGPIDKDLVRVSCGDVNMSKFHSCRS